MNTMLTPRFDTTHSAVPEAIPAEQAAAPAQTHVVQPGEAPDEIATQHGVTEQALRDSNGLGSGQAVYPGTVLQIPPSAPMALVAAGMPQPADTQEPPPLPLPDFSSMTPEQIKAYKNSPEFKDMSAQERKKIEELYNSGRKEEAAAYMAEKMKNMPPEVAAQFAKECKPMLDRMCTDAANDKKLMGQLENMARMLGKTKEGTQVVRDMAESLVGGMSRTQHVNLLQSIDVNNPDGAIFKLALLDSLRTRIAGALPASENLLKDLDQRKAILVRTVVADYNNANAGKEAKDKEFAALLARIGGALTETQKQELYKKFMEDPANKETYEAAAKAAERMGEFASAAPRELAALAARDKDGAKVVADLIQKLAKSGQASAAAALLVATKADPAAVSNLKNTTDINRLERIVGGAVFAEALAENGGDVQKALNAVLETLKDYVDGLDGLMSKIGKILKALESGGVPDATELRNLLDSAGPWANVIGGMLSIGVALTSSTPQQYDASMKAMISAGAATVGTAADVVEILASAVNKLSELANGKGLNGVGAGLESAGARLEKLNEGLKAFGKVFSVLSSSVVVFESIQNMLKDGANAGDIVKMVGALVGIAAVFAPAGPAGPALALAAMVIGVVGDMIKADQDERKLIDTLAGYLTQLGFTPESARTLVEHQGTIKALASQGFSPEQIRVLAMRYPLTFSSPNAESGFIRLMDALTHSGLSGRQAVELLANMSDEQLQKLGEMLCSSPSLFREFGRVSDKAGLIRLLEKTVAMAVPGYGREAAQTMLDALRSS